jgi:hypothetical protein
MRIVRRSSTRLAFIAAGVCGLALAQAAGLWADGPGEKGAAGSAISAKANDGSDAKARRKMAADITPAREAAALTFVDQHHPELSDLLSLLQDQSPKDYDRAIRELFRESERLATMRERDEDRYELELELWKVNSRLRLAAARLSMGDSPELRREIRALLLEQIDARRAVLANDRQKTADRLGKLDKQLEQIDRQRETMAERAFRALVGESQKISTQSPSGGSKRVQ